MAITLPDAYCTLLVSDAYLPGAMVLAHSLRDCGTKKQLVALVALEAVAATTIEQLKTVYNQIIPVDRVTNRSPANLYLMDRPDLQYTFTKIWLWRQTQFRRIVYIDADVVVLRAPDELFARESPFAAAPDVGWPDCFNSGVMALTPNVGDYYALLAMAQRGISFDGADQGLLNMHFSNWDRLSFTYNCTPSGHYQYVPAYKHFQSSISMIHFIGKEKPWTIGREVGGGTGIYDELPGRWWAVYDRHFRGATYTYVPNQGQIPNSIVQQHVKGEAIALDHSQLPAESIFAPPGYKNPTAKPESTAQTENPIQEPTVYPPMAMFEHAVNEAAPPARSQPVRSTSPEAVQPAPITEKIQFTAPMAEWNPAMQPPPADTRPEAANFPQQQYSMSEDRKLFQPPKSYPEPPKDMYYEVPRTPPAFEKPKPIFPWEENQEKPTRVFAEEVSSPEPQRPSRPAPIDTSATSVVSSSQSPTTPTIQITPSEPFDSYSRSNAWDEHPSIERYMNRFSFGRRAKVQVLHSVELTSPGKDKSPLSNRPSLKLTDFPTEVERPSLPVTPAPVSRDMFWGEERDSTGELPTAEGVPQPHDWDPLRKLEELQRRQSEVLAQGPRRPSLDMPQRDLPESAQPVSLSNETAVPQLSVSTDSSSLKHTSAAAMIAAIEDADANDGANEGVFGATGM